MNSFSAAGEQRPTFTHSGHHHPLELNNGLNSHPQSCSACSLPILGGRDYYTCRPCYFSLHSSCFKMPPSFHHPSHPAHELYLSTSMSAASASPCRACANPIGSGFSYGCSICHVHFHSLCLMRKFSISHPSHPLHELSLKFSSPYGSGVGFRCDVCGNPGLPDQWLYRCDLCDFDIHAECSATTLAVTATRSIPTAGPPGGAPPQPPPPPPGYPLPLPPSGSGLQYQGLAGNQLPQPPASVGMGMGMNQTHPQFFGNVYNQPQGIGIGMSQVQPQLAGGGYPNTAAYGNMLTARGAPMASGMGMGSLVMAGVATGVGEGIGQGIVQTTVSAFGHDSGSDQNYL